MSIGTLHRPALADVAVAEVAALYGLRLPEEIDRLRVDLDRWVSGYAAEDRDRAIDAWYRDRVA